MKKLSLLTTAAFFISIFSFAQQQTKLDWFVMNAMKNRSLQDTNITLLVKGNPASVKALTVSAGGTFNYSAGEISSVSIPVNRLPVLASSPAVSRMESNMKKLQLMNDSMLINSNTNPVHNGLPPLPQAYDGAGVVMGIIDTGIDFSHPDFKDKSGNSRIKWLWDHNQPPAANTPPLYGYGQEWSNTDIDAGLAAAHNDEYNYGHGTHVSGIAAGNGLAIGKYKGVAPLADIIVVALNFGSSAPNRIADATNYIYSKAAAMGKPCVINASVGDYFGSHDGLDLEAQLINNLITAQNGRCFVAAAGNTGNTAYHVGYPVIPADTGFTWFSFYPSSIFIDLWADTADFKNVEFSFGADQISPSYSFRGNIPFSNAVSHVSTITYDTLYNNGNRIGRIDTYGQLVGGTYSLQFVIRPDSAAYNWRFITTGSGKFDLWSWDAYTANLADSTVFPDLKKYKQPEIGRAHV